MRTFKTELGTFTMQDFPIIKSKKGNIKLPVMCPILVPRELIVANNYNPNSVAQNNMALLQQSILDNGFCFAIVTVWDEESGKFIIIDGFHRDEILKAWLECDQIPIIVLEHDMAQRMSATIQFNRARGVHSVELMGDLVQSLVNQGLEDEEISKHLGMEAEEVYRLKQITGIAELFKNQTYSKSWGIEVVDNG